MLLNLLTTLLLSAATIIVGALFVMMTIFAITFIRLLLVSCDKAVKDFKEQGRKIK